VLDLRPKVGYLYRVPYDSPQLIKAAAVIISLKGHNRF
jgi:hypothetical protein